MDGLLALYIFTLAAFTGYEIIAKVPVILHTPLMSGSNFVHGVVVVGAMLMLGEADTPVQQAIGWARRIGARQTWLTHIAHELGHEETNRTLPENIRLAYDGLSLPVTLEADR